MKIRLDNINHIKYNAIINHFDINQRELHGNPPVYKNLEIDVATMVPTKKYRTELNEVLKSIEQKLMESLKKKE